MLGISKRLAKSEFQTFEANSEIGAINEQITDYLTDMETPRLNVTFVFSVMFRLYDTDGNGILDSSVSWQKTNDPQKIKSN